MSPPLCPFHSAVTQFQGFCLSSQKQVNPRQQVPYNPPTLEALQDMTLLRSTPRSVLGAQTFQYLSN